MFEKAFRSLKDLVVPDDCEVSCVISDNDPEKSAELTFEALKNEISFPCHYFSEVEIGIVPNRNRLLVEATRQGATYVAFFDDDEIVDPNWIVELYRAARTFNAEAVWGKTIYSLPKAHADWLEKRNFYGGDQPVTGTRRRGASTNNVLIDLGFLNRFQLKFDFRFNDIGGSDSFLFRELKDHGGKVIACREAITYEEVPESRATEEWILRRAYKNSHTEYRRALLRRGSFAAVSLALSYGLWLYLSHMISLFLYPFKGYDFKVYNRRREAKVIGLIDAVKGKTHREYDVVHGN